MASPLLRFSLLLAGLTGVLVALLVLPAQLRVTGHEGDLLHVYDAVFRMAAGDRPHLDFMSPLGLLSFWPIEAFVLAGFGPGRAFLLGQAAVTLALFPAIWWTAASRFEGWPRLLFGAVMVIILTAIVFGGSEPAVSISMHYNRWGWALAFLISTLVMLPPRAGWNAPDLDGIVVGLSLGALAFLKATYVAALLPFLLIALVQDRDVRRAGVAVLAALLVALVIVIGFGGPALISAYIGDLTSVASSDARPYPGLTFADLVAKPAGLPATALLIGTVVLWRRAGRAREGALLLFLAPGWLYITYQNWGNDPKYLILLALYLLALDLPKPTARLFGAPAVAAARGMALAAAVMIAPAVINMSYSSLRNIALDATEFTPVFDTAGRGDVLVQIDRNYLGHTQATMPPVTPPAGWTPPQQPQTVLNGEELPECKLSTGFVGWTHQVVADLMDTPGTEDARIIVADVYDHLWLFGPFERGQTDSVWYYGGSDGVTEADMVVVPFCPLSRIARRTKLRILDDLGELQEIRRTPHFILLSVDR